MMPSRKQLLAGASILGVAGSFAWYCSDTANHEHPPSTIKAPSPADPEFNQYFKNKKGLWIFTRCWGDFETAKGLVFIIHGLGEHSGRAGYNWLADKLVKENYAVWSMDHQGHGKSNGTRTHVSSYHDFLDDLEQSLQIAQAKLGNQDAPTFLLGHSMGGCLTLGFALHKRPNVKGLILSGAAVQMHVDPNYSDVTRAVGKVVHKILPKLEVVPPLPVDFISRNEQACADYAKDPLVWHGGIRCSIGNALISLSEELAKRWTELDLPMTIIHGADDQIVDPSSSLAIFKSKASVSKKELKFFPEMKHELFEDPEREQVSQHIMVWLKIQM